MNLKASRPTGEPTVGTDLASKLQHRRWQLALTQRQAADMMAVNYWTFMTWEKGRDPLPWAYPAIIKFLRYEPWDAPMTLGAQLKAERFRRGLSIESAAEVAGVDEGTFGRWEQGEWNPQQSGRATIEAFLGDLAPLWSTAPRLRGRAK